MTLTAAEARVAAAAIDALNPDELTGFLDGLPDGVRPAVAEAVERDRKARKAATPELT
jgi:Mg/Co/Ni transporter MgtE